MCEKCRGNYYITTPIYYPSAKLHIGHAYCTVATDTMARFKRLQGYNVMFLTGTDEHGQKIEDKAKAAGVTPQQFVDDIVTGERGVLDLWKLMNISNDRFIRTTDDYHVEAVQRIFKKKIMEMDFDTKAALFMVHTRKGVELTWVDRYENIPWNMPQIVYSLDCMFDDLYDYKFLKYETTGQNARFWTLPENLALLVDENQSLFSIVVQRSDELWAGLVSHPYH